MSNKNEEQKLDEIRAKLEKAKSNLIKDELKSVSQAGSDVGRYIANKRGDSMSKKAGELDWSEMTNKSEELTKNPMVATAVGSAVGSYLANKADDEVAKIGGGAGTAGSVNTTGGPSIGSQIGFPGMGKEEVAPENSNNRKTYLKEFEKEEHSDEAEDKKLINQQVDKKIKQHEEKKHSLESHQAEHDKLHGMKAGELDWSEMTGKKR